MVQRRPWRRPYLAMTKLNDLVYRSQCSRKRKPKEDHLEKRSPYYGRDPTSWNKIDRNEQLEGEE